MSTKMSSCPNSKCIKESTHYLGDRIEFDVLSKGPSLVSTLLKPDKGPSLKT